MYLAPFHCQLFSRFPEALRDLFSFFQQVAHDVLKGIMKSLKFKEMLNGKKSSN
jgi:hypothetical protein